MTEQSHGQTAFPTEVKHVGVVVRDLRQAIEYYSSTFGLGPFRIFEEINVKSTLHGKQSFSKLRVGMAPMGQVEFELIQFLDGQSVYREYLEKHGEGVHHLAFEVSDLDKELAKLRSQGVKVLQEGGVTNSTVGETVGWKFAYLDTKVGGLAVEIYEIPGK